MVACMLSLVSGVGGDDPPQGRVNTSVYIQCMRGVSVSKMTVTNDGDVAGGVVTHGYNDMTVT